MRWHDILEAAGVGKITKQNTTVDVKPGETQRQAAKFGNKVDKNGVPPTLSKKVKGKSTNVLFNLGLAESVAIKYERAKDYDILHIKEKGKNRVEVRGKKGYESGGYDSNDKLHKLLDKLGKAANISELMNGETVVLNPKHPDGPKAIDATTKEGSLIPNPKNTFLTKADTAYDHYKVGTNLANLKSVPKGANYDEPDVIIAPYAGNKEMKYLQKQLKRIGYDVQDADGYKDAHFDDKPTGGEAPPQIKGAGALGKIKVGKLKGVQRERTYEKLAKQLERVLDGDYAPLQIDRKGRVVNGHHRLDALRLVGEEYARVYMIDDYIENMLDEGWSKKYKDSINCSNPKGFSQKAHCAGRKKTNEAFVKPQFDVEWEEAQRYPEFEKIGKEAWIKLAGKGKAVTIKSAKDINNTDAADPDSFKSLDKNKQTRALAQLKSGDVEMPIVAVYSDGYKELIGGNTRLTAMMSQNNKATVWQFEVPDEVAELAENFADGKKTVEFEDKNEKFGKVYIDMDGVLVDLYNYIGKKLGVDYNKITQKQWNDFYRNVDAYELFKNAPTFPSTNKLIQTVKDVVGGYTILSKPLGFDRNGSIKGKKEWLAKHISVTPDEVIFEDNKAKYAVSNDTPNILIDDFGQNIQKWNAAGGIGVKYRADKDNLSDVFNAIKMTNENFADGKVKGKSRPGRVKKAGASCKGSVTSLRKKAKNASGERAKMYHWCANMKSGRKKK